jgi:tryptophan synthase alpha chain
MGKVTDLFNTLRQQERKAFTVYIPFGFPESSATRGILRTLEESGVDLIELGMPFSDPLADGKILQEASIVALKGGATTDKLFSLLGSLKNSLTVPLVIMTYYNPVFRYGTQRFIAHAADCGIAGCMIVDLPVDEADVFRAAAGARDVDTVFFVTPVTPQRRAKRILKACRGFVYYVSITGITGPARLSLSSIAKHIRQLKTIAGIPVCVGFGIHTAQQVKDISRVSDGVIVGSAVARFIRDNFKTTNFYTKLGRYVRSLKKGLHT